MDALVFDTGPLRHFAQAGKREGVECTRTLPLLCDAIHRGLLSLDEVSDIADDLIVTDYRLPFEPGQFARWATDEGFLAVPQYDMDSGTAADAS